MAMSAGAVLLRPTVIIAGFIVLLELGCYWRLSRTFRRFRHWSPQDTECSAQRDELQQKGTGEEPGHGVSGSIGGLAAKELSRETECDFITKPSIYFEPRTS
ncbi:hypothetical protein EKJ_23850 [Qipengyuania flava]|uniref:Uncharacterized protein n=2 Tax=Qipengyuania flava TaxID=192812 RepID=A0A3T1CL01_9SPHN|nr:hypothetical protein EKJ_23850 [Qipengyuania flava]